MTSLALHRASPSSRLAENLRDIPFAIHEHLLSDDSVLRPKQREAISTVSEKIFGLISVLAMIMPTGTGKTVIIAQMLKGLKLDEQSDHSAKKILIVSDSKEGVRQTKDKLKKYAGIDAGAYYSDEKDLTKDICVTTYDSWQRKDFPIDPLGIDLVILDESHKSISKARLDTLKKYDNAIWMALTATPTYSEERDLLSYFELGYKLTLPEAVEHKLICGFRNILLRSNIDIDLEEIGILSNGEYNEKALARALNKEARNRIAGEHLLYGVHPDTGKPLRDIRGIISCVDVKHAIDIEDHINNMYNESYPENTFEHGFVRAIHGDSKDRDDLLQWHKEGKIGYLAYADLLNQNYDDCGIGVCLNLRLSRSKVLVMQRAGRTERLDENDPYKIALIIDVLDTYKGEEKRRPLFYADTIGHVVIIPEDARQAAKEEKFQRNKSTQQLSIKNIDIKALELRIVTNEEEILSILPEDESSVNVRNKTENDLAIDELTQLTQLSYSTIYNAFLRIIKDSEDYDPELDEEKPLISVEKVRGENNRVSYSISKEKLELFKKKYLEDYLIPLKADDDLTSVELVELTQRSRSSVNLYLSKLSQAWENYNKNPESHEKPHIGIHRVKLKDGRYVDSIKRDQLNIFKEEYVANDDVVVPIKTENDLSTEDIKNLTGLGNSTIQKSFDKIAADWKYYNEDRESRKQPPVKLTIVRTMRQRLVPSISLQELEIYKKTYLADYLVPQKTDDDLIIEELMEITQLGKNVLQKTFNNIHVEWQAYEADPTSQEKPSVPITRVKKDNGRYADSIHRAHFEIYKQKYLHDEMKRFKTENDLTVPDVMRIASLPESTVQKAFNKLLGEWDDYRGNPETKEKPSIETEKIRIPKGVLADSIPLHQLDAFIEKFFPQRLTVFMQNKDAAIAQWRVERAPAKKMTP